jgi:hypothetical protein
MPLARPRMGYKVPGIMEVVKDRGKLVDSGFKTF